ncbi:MAG TPA: 3-deoxy-7-phosphoheptulonate synthase [Candidatus Onthocola gallistercoris]|uniref:Phospho-2-dehydro-3-deoxyheptonate aldolase n=1 Tax=Candidatus Onthocola gallistercoris TaxID=2840876 RepID=A0A9D1HFF4_9FIRM|nr:3-deoxy-7-phosphoheptulonate synthase [Candidatus Onthocola gallistercoris]
MSFEFKKKLPIPREIKEMYPMSEALTARKQKMDQKIIDVITGASDKFLVIIGPCSADSEDSVCEYIGRLARLQEKVADRLILVPRIYTNKPRTTGEGYKGMLHQPDPEKEPDLLQGIIAIRKLHMKALADYGLPIADEMLYPENYWYLSDILSYIAIGARSVEDQQHRLVTSGFDVAAGMKNPTSGDFAVMLNSVVAAQTNHNFIYRGWDVNTTGNPYAHTILRGSVNKYSRSRPNYHYEDLIKLYDMYQERNLQNPATIVDANHANSDKQFKEQIRIVKEVLHSRSLSPEIHKLVKGVMIESYLEEGCQKIGSQPHIYGKSITDPCLGWEDSERLIYEIAERC